MKDGPPITYAATGVNYDSLDRFKRLAQLKAAATASHLEQFDGMSEVSGSRGESAYVWEESDAYRAFVIEGLGTKNLVADEARVVTGRSHYDSVAQDTVAMVVNDLIVVGAAPQVVNAYFAVGNSEWFNDEQRAEDLVNGWAQACTMANAVWGGGETPSLKGILTPDAIDLSGSAVGIIQPKERLVLGDKLSPGDAIVLVESSGIHANGLTLARAIADKLPERYATKLTDGRTYADHLLTPSYIYARLVQDAFREGVDIRYMVNITGHGWRKLMRARNDLRYVIDTVPEPQPIFSFIQKHSGNSDREMYGNFNMGAGFALFIPQEHVTTLRDIAASNHSFKILHAGYVKEGPREVVIRPKGITFGSEQLRVRQ